MKTPYYSGSFTAAQHTDVHENDELRERMLEHRLANRDDVRDIYVVTIVPLDDRLWAKPVGLGLKKAAKTSRTDMSWAMHWAIQVGDQFFELQRGYPDPLRTGLRMSKWDEERQSKIIQRYRQGVTAMTDDEIKAVGERYFSRLERIDINVYGVWCNNCHIAVERMLQEIGGLYYYRSKLRSLQDWVRESFYEAILSYTKMYGRFRGWNEELITKYTNILHRTLRVMTARSKYPKRHWIRNDIEAADGALKKIGTVKDHWFLTILESSLSLRKGSEDLYVRRGADGKPELNFDALREATKGIFDEDGKWRLAWLKALPWLTAGFLVGTPRWAAAVISIAISHAQELYEDRMGLSGGLEQSLTGLGVSPKLQGGPSTSSTRPKLQNQRRVTNGQRRVRSKTLSTDSKLVARYERCLTIAGVPYFYDHLKKTRSWDAPDQQELCLRIVNPPLSRKWEEKQEEGRTLYVNRITGETTDTRPGAAEVWAVKKRVKPDWVKSTIMALPLGWEMRRTEEGEMFYLNHNENPPMSTTCHPMRQELEDERRALLPEWNVEWDNDRGKKYRRIQVGETGEIRWKAVDGPRHDPVGDKTRIVFEKPKEAFIEPLPPGWTVAAEDNGRRVYKNGKNGKERIERTTHPLTDKRRRLQPEWEMRYTPGNRSYWVHYGSDGRGTTWWTRNRLLKNTSLKNNASGWKLAKDGYEWEFFEGGDVPHSEVPVLDLDDPAEIEFREYPFILPKRMETKDGAFIEPLPPNWVMRTEGDGSVHYWNFKDEVRSEQHPNEEERRNLPALWEMRFTRHGRQYFIDHDDGSTWWTHPREDKHEQKLRARPGQSQNGWKIAEDGKTWERFQDHPDAEHAEQSMNALSHTQTTDSQTSQDEPATENWRSLSRPREWIKHVNSSDVVVNAMTRIPKTPKLFRKSQKSTSSSSTSVGSQKEVFEDEDQAEEKWLEEPGGMTEESEFSEEPDRDVLSSQKGDTTVLTGKPGPNQELDEEAMSSEGSSTAVVAEFQPGKPPEKQTTSQEKKVIAVAEEPRSNQESEGGDLSQKGIISVETEESQSTHEPEQETSLQNEEVTEEPRSNQDSEQTSSQNGKTKKSWTPIQDQMKRFKTTEKLPIFAAKLINSPRETLRENNLFELRFQANSETKIEALPSDSDSKTASPPQRDAKKRWVKHAASSILAMRKGKWKNGSEEELTVPDEEVLLENDLESVADALGITSTESFDNSGGAVVLSSIDEKIGKEHVLGKREGKVDGVIGSAEGEEVE